MRDQVTTPIYLDHAATTPLSETAWAAMLPHLRETYGNASAMHQIGRAAHDVKEASRVEIATALGVNADEIILTGSGTEADNLALFGLTHAARERGRHLIVSQVEHQAVLEAALRLERDGWDVTYLPVDAWGRVSVEAVVRAMLADTVLVSVMLGNNEIGTIEPVAEIATAVRAHAPDPERPPLIHSDACQAVGLLPVAPGTLGVDALTINSSKIYGPKGVGALYVRRGVAIDPHVIGGHQERGRRAGTENVALIAGFAAALTEAVERQAAEAVRLTKLRDEFTATLCEQVPSGICNGHPTERLPHNVHICVPDVEGESLVLLLDQAGICAATGSACASFDLEPSYVLSAIGRDAEIIHGSVRFTLGRETTEAQLSYVAEQCGAAVSRLARITASPFIHARTNGTRAQCAR
jgi:cysteine desulfurase